MANTYYELAELIDKTESMGIHVVTDDTHVTAKSLTIIIDDKDDDKREQVSFKTLTEEGEIETYFSPFTWRLGKAEFIKWASVATVEPYATFNRLIARIIRLMTVEDFEKLRKHKNLEAEMSEYLYTELAYVGIGKVKLTRGALIHISMIYGGLLSRKHGIQNFIEQLFEMVLKGDFIADKCRSCMWCKNHTDRGTGRICRNPLNEGFVIPAEIKLGDVLYNFPDIDVKKYAGNYRECVTRWVPAMMPTCEFYNRRW